MKTRFSAILLTFLLATGSVWAKDSYKSAEPPHSGFLRDYSKVWVSTDQEGLWLHIDKSKDYKGYAKVMLNLEVYNNPNVDDNEVKPRLLYEMSDNMLASLSSALTPGYEVVHEPGPDVLRFRISISGVRLVKPPTELTNLIPVKAAMDVVLTATGSAPKVAEMTAEMEVLDADNNRLAAAIVIHKADERLSHGDIVTWADVQPITDYLAKGLRQGLDQLRGAGR